MADAAQPWQSFNAHTKLAVLVGYRKKVFKTTNQSNTEVILTKF